MKVNFMYPIKIDKRYNHYPGPFAIDEIDLNRIFRGIKKVKTKECYKYVKGGLEEQNLVLINKLVKHLQPNIIVEVGTFKGRTTYNMAKNSLNSKIITIDIADCGTKTFSGTDVKYYQPPNYVGKYFNNRIVGNRIHQIIGDSLNPYCQEKLDEMLKGRKIDFAFIDAGHDYDSVRHNFEELILPRLAKGGVVVFDDYNRPLSILGVSHYLLEKAYKDGYVFYWYAPRKSKWTNEVIFLNVPQARCYNWRNIDE